MRLKFSLERTRDIVLEKIAIIIFRFSLKLYFASCTVHVSL